MTDSRAGCGWVTRVHLGMPVTHDGCQVGGCQRAGMAGCVGGWGGAELEAELGYSRGGGGAGLAFLHDWRLFFAAVFRIMDAHLEGKGSEL